MQGFASSPALCLPPGAVTLRTQHHLADSAPGYSTLPVTAAEVVLVFGICHSGLAIADNRSVRRAGLAAVDVAGTAVEEAEKVDAEDNAAAEEGAKADVAGIAVVQVHTIVE